MTTYNSIGLYRRADYILGGIDWPDAIVSRKTIRALLPPGVRRNGINPVTSTLKLFLRNAEERGLIERSALFVRVLDPRQLLANALRELPGRPSAHDFLELGWALSLIPRQIAEEPNEAVVTRRQAELELLRALR
ncbi:hypothetical protein [Mycobacterium avium]|uniref:hypothetical protein n=1 Tax=Mycobacterium avium TaxID=1764 RepID=UPI001CC81DEA|nr:hypothetical protein [Mycobacterium avium]MBZ4580990.1 hypothetical protein [Mycobacterium avium subsp. hominissuis]MBZ4608913.1 hypothetical protein [Mycobacterium avium subsp. hominissuis]